MPGTIRVRARKVGGQCSLRIGPAPPITAACVVESGRAAGSPWRRGGAFDPVRHLGPPRRRVQSGRGSAPGRAVGSSGEEDDRSAPWSCRYRPEATPTRCRGPMPELVRGGFRLESVNGGAAHRALPQGLFEASRCWFGKIARFQAGLGPRHDRYGVAGSPQKPRDELAKALHRPSDQRLGSSRQCACARRGSPPDAANIRAAAGSRDGPRTARPARRTFERQSAHAMLYLDSGSTAARRSGNRGARPHPSRRQSIGRAVAVTVKGPRRPRWPALPSYR